MDNTPNTISIDGTDYAPPSTAASPVLLVTRKKVKSA